MDEIVNGSEPSPELKLFKFRAINKHMIDSLVLSRLWCAKPESLNDPFDCQVDIHKSWARATSSATGRQKDWLQSGLDNPEFLKFAANKLSAVGICSFSLDLCEHTSASVQWSHYADEHRGVCLLYRFPESFINAPVNKVIGVDKVIYKDNHLTNWLINDAPTEQNKFLVGLATNYFLTKSPAWKYEKEVRLVRQEPGFLNIPWGFLEQVCFGLNTPQTDIELVKKMAIEHCGCKKFCRIIRDEESDFGIRAVDI